MEQIKNIEQLLFESNKKGTLDEKIEYIMNYFLKNVNYDYAYLFAKGYGQGSISKIDPGFKFAPSKLENDKITSVVLSRGIQEGQSQIFNDIIQMQDDSQGNYDLFIQNLRTYVTNELGKHLGNKEVIDSNVDKFMTQVSQDLLEKKLKVTVKDKQYELNYDISSILIEYILNADKIFPPVTENGLLQSGVCDHYSDYLLNLFNSMGIEVHKIEGTSELGHAWIVVKGDTNYKSIDLTRSIFIRDGFLGIPKEQTCKDWLCCDIHKIFEMQKTRTITKIDSIELPCAITRQNHQETDFSGLMEKNQIISTTKTGTNSLKGFLEIGLRDGIGQTECTNAERNETIKESEVNMDEQ